MALDEQSTWDLLRELDDPERLEFPRDYDAHATRARFERLAARLAERFDCICDVDRYVQDASHHGRIEIPARATESGEQLTVTVSNFGGMAVLTLGNPGAYDADEEQVLLDAADRLRVESELAALGYVGVSEHLLWTEYNGTAASALRHVSGGPTWWHRFFDYL